VVFREHFIQSEWLQAFDEGFMDNSAKPIAPRFPIAVIGIGCRYPGGINNPGGFWDTLVNGTDALAGKVQSRQSDTNLSCQNLAGTQYNGVVENIDHFDADFFGIPPTIANKLDPQQRLLLEVSWEALEDAGIQPSRLAGTSTGVFIGAWLQDFESQLTGKEMLDGLRDADLHSTTGSGRYSLAGRLSYFYGFQGPSFVVDAHCSSSLVAIHLACQSIWMEESQTALAGGVNIVLSPFISAAYSRSGMLAPDGRCKFGDAKADGYVRSEGCGLIVLKPLSRALSDGDDIYAVVLGSAVNNNGQSSGFLTTPGYVGQQEVLRKAYRWSGISPGQVQYVEAHGTGTPTGDLVELKALVEVLADGRAAGNRCFVGSVKTNIGHTEGAAGVAGLIKVALALKNRQIPASLHFSDPNPGIDWGTAPLRVSTANVKWPSSPSIAGVSSFGITGTNAHVVLKEPPEPPIIPNRRSLEKAQSRTPLEGKFLFPLSAKSPEALFEKAKTTQAWLKECETSGLPISIEAICSTAAHCRDHLEHRVAFTAGTVDELRERLAAIELQDLVNRERSPGKPKVVFVYPGQGSQYHGMCRRLIAQSSVFKASLERCASALEPYCNWSLLSQLTAAEKGPREDEIDVVQPLLFSIQIALSTLWRAFGVEPDAVVGHSMGEVAAACVCGALTIEEGAKVITTRSQLMKRTSGFGSMALVELPLAKATEEIAGMENELSAAVCNSPRSTVLSGTPQAIDVILQRFENRGIFCRRINVDVASHSPQMDQARQELIERLRGLRPKLENIPIYSTVAGESMCGQGFDESYWGDNLRKPVLFSNAVTRLLANEHTVFIEMSPHPILLRAIEETAAETKTSADSFCLTLASLTRDTDNAETLLASLGALYETGYPVDWKRFCSKPKLWLKLPSYPWQRKRYWFDEVKQPRAGLSITTPRAGIHEKPPDPRDTEEPTTGGGTYSLRESVTAATSGQPRCSILEDYLKRQMAKILGTTASRLDIRKAFKAYGMDSLGAIRFRSRIESDTGLQLSATIVWNYPSIKQLAAYLSEKMESQPAYRRGSTPARHAHGAIEHESADLEALLKELEPLSDEEARKLLNDEH
jgi:acyl transferase domain-containing protein